MLESFNVVLSNNERGGDRCGPGFREVEQVCDMIENMRTTVTVELPLHDLWTGIHGPKKIIWKTPFERILYLICVLS